MKKENKHRNRLFLTGFFLFFILIGSGFGSQGIQLGATLFSNIFAGTQSIAISNSTGTTDLLIDPVAKTSGNLFDAQVNNVSKIHIDYLGDIIGSSSVDANFTFFSTAGWSTFFGGASGALGLGSGHMIGWDSATTHSNFNLVGFDTNLTRYSAGIIQVGTGATANTNGSMFLNYLGKTVGGSVASASTITPTGGIFHVTGVTTINTINIPFTGFTGAITIIPDGIFSTGLTGNIALASTATVSKVLSMTYDGTKWYPSY